MELVPAVEQNFSFWELIQTWPPKNETPILPEQEKRETDETKLESSRNEGEGTSCDENQQGSANQTDVAPIKPAAHDSNDNAPIFGDSSVMAMRIPSMFTASPAPFLRSSILWIPGSRKDWEDSVSELTAICTSAAYRRHNSAQAKPFHPPLSREYIKDRVNIDDPLRGYQIRHATGGWLQGFLLWTNFTTWTHYFTWDSLNPLSGLASTVHAKDDAGGRLAKELQSLPRHGDPSAGGIVFDHVAEIALLGGLGCGELLLRMALEEIRNSPNRYQYVVLQATEGSRSFYEKFGFARVGAVCRYGASIATAKGMLPSSSQFPDLDTPEQGYRHWTHANESQQSLDLHGGPSYMMCLKLPPMNDTSVPNGNLMESMQQYQVFDKPMIQQLGGVATLASTRRNARVISTRLSGKPCITDNTTVPNPSSTLRTPVLAKNKFADDAGVRGTHNIASRKRPKIWKETTQLVNPLMPGQPAARQQDQLPSPSVPSQGNKLKITIFPHTLLLSSAPSSAVIPAVTPTDCSNLPGPSIVDAPITTTEASRNGGDASPSITEPANGKTTWASAKTSAIVKSTLKKKVTTRSKQGASGKKIGRPPKGSKVDARAVSVTQARGSTNVPELSLPSLSSLPQIQASEYLSKHAGGSIFPIDRSALCKQKVKSYPRDRVHFFNKVVRSKAAAKSDPTFYFVLHYDDALSKLSPSKPRVTVIPMRARGVLAGKRAGRPRYQCVVLDTSANWTTDAADKYEAASAFMVMKTPFVGQEAWDVLID